MRGLVAIRRGGHSALSQKCLRRQFAAMAQQKVHDFPDIAKSHSLTATRSGAASGSRVPENFQSSSAPWAFAQDEEAQKLWSETSFADMNIHPAIVEALNHAGIETPTQVQAKAFAPLSRGR